MDGDRANSAGKNKTVSDEINASWARLIDMAKAGTARPRSVDEHVKAERVEAKKVDGRTLRRTGRTEQLNVRVAADTKAEIQAIANAQEWLIGEVIEKAVAALKSKMDAGN